MISVTILVKNGERRLAHVLDSLKNFNEVLVVDTGSTDSSIEIANSFLNTRVVSRNFIGFGPSHNEAAELAKHDWILSLDADEVLSPALNQEILSLKLNPHCVYSLPFKNFFNGKWIRWCGWYPESHVRLYHRKSTCFTEALVHEGVQTEGKRVILLKNFVHHYSYDSLSDFLVKMERYSTLFAQQSHLKKQSSPFKAIIHGLGAFLKSYVIKRGFMGGFEGFVISMYNGHTAFYKYLKLYQLNASSPHVSSDWNRQTCQSFSDAHLTSRKP